MPSIDLEAALASVRSTSGRKVACEPLDGDDHSSADAPPESFWLSKDAEFDWFDRNAFLERKESTRGNSIRSTSNSQRFSHNLNSKSKAAAIIGLPKTQNNTFCEKRRCKPLNVRLFPPKRPESVGKSTARMNEPSSPKVSCIGRVRSKRSRRRKPENKVEKAVVRSEPVRRAKRIGFCGGFVSLFRSDRRRRDGAVVKCEDSSVKSSSHRKKKNRSRRCENTSVSNEPIVEPAGLGGMKRFVSGRRTESWDGVE